MKTRAPGVRQVGALTEAPDESALESKRSSAISTDPDLAQRAYEKIIVPGQAGSTTGPIEGVASTGLIGARGAAVGDKFPISTTKAVAMTLGLDTQFRSRAPAKYFGWLQSIRKLRPRMLQMSDAELRDRFAAIGQKIQSGRSPESVLPEAFAIIRETSRRVLDKEHYEVQLLAAMTLVDGNVAQLKTGEGKTLSASLAASLFALVGKGVHVVTTNGYLAAHDAEELSPLYEALGLSVGVVQSGAQTYDEKRAAYACDVTYGHCNTFAFDWLEDQVWWKEDFRVQRGLPIAIVDEADDVLLDTAQQPLVLCGAPESQDAFEDRKGHLRLASEIVGELDTPDNVFVYFEGEKQRPHLTDDGVGALQRIMANKLGLPNEQSAIWNEQNAELLHQVRKSLEARYAVAQGKEYINDGEGLTVINEATGHPNPGGRLRHGLMDAVLINEGKDPEPELQTIGLISYQHFFNMYGHIAGMTGTARGGKDELRDLYGMAVVEIPTHKPVQRIDEDDRYFAHPALRDLAAVADVLSTHETGQPVLVSAVSVTASKYISARLSNPLLCFADVAVSSDPLLRAMLPDVKGGDALIESLGAGSSDEARALARGRVLELIAADPEGQKRLASFLDNKGLPASKLLEHAAGIEHRTLNAETHAQEADIIRMAGQKDAVTVATQMAGRGVDIPLGEGIEALGGLRVVGVEHKTNPRKDDQARGRAGRQGARGSSCFYVSASDEVLSFLPAHRLRDLADRLGSERVEQPTGALARRWEKAIDRAQNRAEVTNEFDRRRSTKMDTAIRFQRRAIVETRNDILDRDDLPARAREWVHERIDELLAQAVIPGGAPKTWKRKHFEKLAYEMERKSRKLDPNQARQILFTLSPDGSRIPDESMSVSELHQLADRLLDEYTPKAMKAQGQDEAGFNQYIRDTILFNLDQGWVQHLLEQERQKETAYLAAYGEVDPWVAYTRQASAAFDRMQARTRSVVADGLMFHLQTNANPVESS